MPAYGDPALAIALPVEQFTLNYTIMSVVNPSAFTGNFVNIVVASGELPAVVYLDSVKIPSNQFHDIPGSFYKYAQIGIVQGTHNVSSFTPFGLTVYALGNVDSYAYTGGALVKPLNGLSVTSATASPSEVFTSLMASDNPFATSTVVRYSLSRATSVRFELVDEVGRQVELEIHGRLQVGEHSIRIEGTALPNGFYYGRLIAGDGSMATIKLRKVR